MSVCTAGLCGLESLCVLFGCGTPNSCSNLLILETLELTEHLQTDFGT